MIPDLLLLKECGFIILANGQAFHNLLSNNCYVFLILFNYDLFTIEDVYTFLCRSYTTTIKVINFNIFVF